MERNIYIYKGKYSNAQMVVALRPVWAKLSYATKMMMEKCVMHSSAANGLDNIDLYHLSSRPNFYGEQV